MEQNSKKIFYSMGEVSEMLDVTPSLLRFWEKRFDIIKPHKNKKGNRMFTPADVENLKLIYHLVKEKGMTLDGAAKVLKKGKAGLTRDTELIERLMTVRSLLAEIRQELYENDPEAVTLLVANEAPAETAAPHPARQPETATEPAATAPPAPGKSEPAPEVSRPVADTAPAEDAATRRIADAAVAAAAALHNTGETTGEKPLPRIVEQTLF